MVSRRFHWRELRLVARLLFEALGGQMTLLHQKRKEEKSEKIEKEKKNLADIYIHEARCEREENASTSYSQNKETTNEYCWIP